jgi:hypothetical protein
MAEAQRDAVDRLGERLESLAAIGFVNLLDHQQCRDNQARLLERAYQ